MPIIENAYLYYTKIAEPGDAFDKTKGKVYSVDACVPKAVAKEFSKQFPKQAAKSFDNDEFKERFRTESVPYPEQDEQFVIKLKKNASYADRETGMLIPIADEHRPRVFDSEGTDITEKHLVGNGSTGAVAYDVVTMKFNGRPGEVAKLNAVRVDNLIPFERSASQNSRAELFGGKPAAKAVAAEPVRRPSGSRASKPSVDDDDRAPF